MEFHISASQLNEFAPSFWNLAGDARVFAFHGEMGAGKTTLITALCRAKGVQDVASSPTFSIINEYAYHANNDTGSIYHIDLYRLNSMEEVVQAGVEDCVFSGAICLVEWPERAPFLFDEKTMHVYVTPLSETERQVKMERGKLD